MQPYRYAIGIGSNRRHGRHGAPAAVVRAAIAAIDADDIAVVARSPIIATPALGPAGRSFANAAVIVETRLDPPALLARLKGLEAAFGRRRGRRWGARVLDLDILLWSEGGWAQRRGQRLTIPHRELERRDFVLRPLLAIAPGWPVGEGRRTVRHARARLLRGAG
ncbi:2-amino-4-hydroxy-6-hydroxymethyldihydropteridine diphosphokinase [Rhizorhabdus wittichii]|uniref:2-amino-4-hydroxy-6-hydroxymethyldihydropteridine pyrophosphokinase n=1 Tax=Rhizorhabdus wittichii TaxID=160791 RepID=A0A975HE12_9SPHN|nr:2-amino-4-hydroxy-6-hydroxymethyldihydropteridine diphosphokinase [Rhizorhabdus wittichii]QTH21960.1 2-amino-4-hydroxy-6-hydroxymethyldihydropteridine diphosphokinase [Rhizorhabdus wittichii]